MGLAQQCCHTQITYTVVDNLAKSVKRVVKDPDVRRGTLVTIILTTDCTHLLGGNPMSNREGAHSGVHTKITISAP